MYNFIYQSKMQKKKIEKSHRFESVDLLVNKEYILRKDWHCFIWSDLFIDSKTRFLKEIGIRVCRAATPPNISLGTSHGPRTAFLICLHKVDTVDVHSFRRLARALFLGDLVLYLSFSVVIQFLWNRTFLFPTIY